MQIHIGTVSAPLGHYTATRLGITIPELRERIRQINREFQEDPSRCNWCQLPFETPGRPDRKWCGKDCHRLGNRYKHLL
jgi:hypothetical protein